MKKEKRIKFENLQSVGMDEIYCEWFRCPICEEREINSDTHYCPNCGAHIIYSKKND